MADQRTHPMQSPDLPSLLARLKILAAEAGVPEEKEEDYDLSEPFNPWQAIALTPDEEADLVALCEEDADEKQKHAAAELKHNPQKS